MFERRSCAARSAMQFATGLICLAAIASSRADELRVVVAGKLPPAAQRACDELRDALAARGHTNTVVDGLPPPTPATSVHSRPSLVLGIAGGNAEFDRFLADRKMAVPAAAESLLVQPVDDDRTLVVAGRDERGLVYALRDAARGVAVLPEKQPWRSGIVAESAAPLLRVRNVSVHLFNADCEREWFFSEEFWRFYFQRLSLARFNRCTLTFCDQTNYLCPPYAYLVEMPEYPEVRVADCTLEQRAQNRKMLRRIAELADEYAIDFDLGIWMQAPVEKWAAAVQVTGLPQGLEHARYCALGLRRVLEACPSIDGIQLRMNAEAGVPEDEQTEFYRPLFRALAEFQSTVRPQLPLRLELRYKGLTQATIDAAVQEKLDVTVSTKYWAEHFGLPYHPTAVDSHYAADRYSFGTLLRKPRNYRVTYQLWNVGSQRLTLWGDPDYAARFARSCTLGGGEGFEVFAPLTNKGYGNRPGAWPVIKDPAYRVGKWEQERYWAFYLAFGRMGYDPAAKLDFWTREFRNRFGAAAEEVDRAYRAASWVLPLITAQLLPSASEWYWWPELDTGGGLREYARIPPSDPARLTPIRTWERTPAWRWEQWDATPGLLESSPTKQSPSGMFPTEVADYLTMCSVQLRLSAEALSQNVDETNAELRITVVDLRILAALAAFHGAKLRAATHFAFYETLHERAQLTAAVDRLRTAREAWHELVRTTDAVYSDDLVFGITPEMPRSKQGHYHSGHWRDRLAEIDADLKMLVAATKQSDGGGEQSAAASLPESLRGPHALSLQHAPPSAIIAGRGAMLRCTIAPVQANLEIRTVRVRYRALDQTTAWQMRQMTPIAAEANVYEATLPAEVIAPQFDLEYYFEVEHNRGASLLPDFLAEPQYFVVPVEAAAR